MDIRGLGCEGVSSFRPQGTGLWFLYKQIQVGYSIIDATCGQASTLGNTWTLRRHLYLGAQEFIYHGKGERDCISNFTVPKWHGLLHASPSRHHQFVLL